MAQNGGIIGPVKCLSTPVTKVTSFTSSGTFNRANCQSTTASEILVVAGGGGGGSNKGGGGAAGGYRTATCVSLTNAMSVTVGGGGGWDRDWETTSCNQPQAHNHF